jgi:4-hydroxy-2-oxoheptanedioate aldolase
VDGVFFGPGDLSASMGLIGQQDHPQVVAAISEGIAAVKRAGKAPGMLSASPQRAKEYLAHGATFVAVGSDTTLLVRAAKELLAAFKDGAAPPKPSSGVY